MGEVNDAIIKKTQDTLGKIIKKPPLTDKLLARPPFRFLHDIMTSVIKGTGFMKGLFTEEEMNSESIKEKEQKISFLQKVIDVVALATGKSLSVKPTKIVAGLDADKTNEMLQALAEAVSKSASNSDDLVKQVLGGGRAGSGKSSSRSKEAGDKDAAPAATEKSNRKAADKEGSSSGTTAKDQKAEPPAKDAAPSAAAAKEKSDSRRQAEERVPPASSQQQSKDERRESKASRSERGGGGSNEPERGAEQANVANGGSSERRNDRDDKRRERARDKEGSGRTRDSGDDQQQQQLVGGSRQQSAGSGSAAVAASAAAAAESTEGGDKAMLNGSKDDEDPPANRIPRPSSAKGSRRPHREGRRVACDSDEDDEHGPDKKDDAGGAEEGDAGSGLPPASEPRRLVRPSSARPAPPRVRKQEGSAGSEHGSLQERVDSGKRVANLITENGDKSDDDDDTFIIQDGLQDAGTTLAERTSRDAAPSGSINAATDDGEHGGLVKKILETRKEFEGKQQSRQTTEGSTKGDTQNMTITEATLRKERELVQREVDKLRASIQTLTRSANPLGKVMDYVQEDVDAMHKELLSWKKENRELAQQLRREQSITDSSVEPLRAQLAELEQTIVDRLDLIAAIKHNITRNDDRMEKMLGTISRT